MECFPLSFLEMMLIKLIIELILVAVISFFCCKRSISKNTVTHNDGEGDELVDHSAIVQILPNENGMLKKPEI